MAALPFGLTLDTLLLITLVGHSVLAAGTFVRARLDERPVNRWTTAVLVAGVVGLAAYYLTGE